MGPRTVGTVDPSTDWTPERSRPGWSSFRGSARPEEITPPRCAAADMGGLWGKLVWSFAGRCFPTCAADGSGPRWCQT